MTDNVSLNAMAGGQAIATDEISSVHYQRVKQAFGADGIYDGDARAPNIFKTVSTAAAGDTALWTPASGKKFRLLKLSVQVTADVAQASGGVLVIALRDATTPIGVTFSVFVPSLAATVFSPGFDLGWID